MKRVRLPLYAKILGWFFLNIVVLATVVFLLFDAQFHFNLEWLFSTGASDRLEAVRALIIGELETTPPDDWEQVLRRYSDAHHVKFGLFDDDANPLVGEVAELPADVRRRILSRPGFGPPRRPPDSAAGPPISTDPAATPRPSDTPRRRWPRPPLRALMRTSNPTSYWLLASGRLDNPMLGDPMRIIIVGSTPSISAGGMIIDAKPWIAVGLGAFVFSLLFWVPPVRGITRAIGRMMHATRQIAAGRFDVRIKTNRSDELGSLGEAIDQMAARLDGLIQGQKRFLGDIAHELCSPLARMQMALGVLEQRATPDQAPYIRSAAEKAEQISALVGELLSFSKASFGASALRLEPVQLLRVVNKAVEAEKTDSSVIRVDVPEHLRVAADSELLTRAIANVVRNAVQHAGSPGYITLDAAEHAGEITLTISDSGPGVPEDELPKIFDAFYRLDTSRTRGTGGTGLGLAIVKTCVESCCGSVAARNRKPHGLEVVLRLQEPGKLAAPESSDSMMSQSPALAPAASQPELKGELLG